MGANYDARGLPTARLLIVSLALASLELTAQLDRASLVPLYRQALAEREKEFGADHPKVARSATDLGLYLRSIGEANAAAPYLARALEINAKTLLPTSRQLAEDMENLASVSPPEQAIELYRKAAGCEDPEVSARNWGRIGDFAAAKGDGKGAAQAYRTALQREEAASGRVHPRVAVRLNDLAQVLDPKAAEPILRRALAVETKSLGLSNPATAVTMNNLASALLGLRNLVEAESLARQSLKILENTLGENHSRVATVSSNLAGILREKPDLPGARRFYTRALAIDEAFYGPNHPEVEVDLRNLAEVLQAMGARAEAKRLTDRADSISTRP